MRAGCWTVAGLHLVRSPPGQAEASGRRGLSEFAKSLRVALARLGYFDHLARDNLHELDRRRGRSGQRLTGALQGYRHNVDVVGVEPRSANMPRIGTIHSPYVQIGT